MNQAQAARQTPEEIEPEHEAEQREAGQRDVGQREHGQPEQVDLEGAEFEEADLEDLEDLEDEEEVEADIERMTLRILSRARQRIREQPLTAATGAFIVGFAIGNGVPKFLARAGIAIGLRMVMQRMFDRAEIFEADD